MLNINRLVNSGNMPSGQNRFQMQNSGKMPHIPQSESLAMSTRRGSQPLNSESMGIKRIVDDKLTKASSKDTQLALNIFKKLTKTVKK